MSSSNSTKSALAASMKNLMKRKSFSKISVGEICENCGINRKSFYYHFRDKYDLVNWIYYVDFLEHMQAPDLDTGWDIFASICHYFYRESAFYRNALQIEGQNSFQHYFQETLAVYLRSLLQESVSDPDQKDFSITFYCDALFASIYRWLTAREITPVEEYLNQIRETMETSRFLLNK